MGFRRLLDRTRNRSFAWIILRGRTIYLIKGMRYSCTHFLALGCYAVLCFGLTPPRCVPTSKCWGVVIWIMHSFAITSMQLQRRLHVRKREVLALVKKRLSRNFRQSVREAIPEVQARRVIALAEPPPRLASSLRVLNGDRHQFYRRSLDEEVKFVPTGQPRASLDD